MSDDSSIMRVSISDFRSWQRERAEALAKSAEMQEKAAFLERKMEAAKVLFPDLCTISEPAIERVMGDPAQVKTWADLIRYALAHATGGITQADMLEVGRKIEGVADRIQRNPNGLYITVKNLERRGQIVRQGLRFYLPATWQAIVQGEMEDKVPEGAADEPQGIVLAFLADGKPRLPREVASVLSAHPRTAASVKKNVNYVYNLLRRMCGLEKLKKLPDGTYVRADKENGPPAELPLGGPDAEGAATPSFENVVGFPQPR